MNTQYVERASLTLIGLSARTTNAEEAAGSGRLPQLWQQYLESGQLGGAAVDNPHLVYALYTDYESDASGAYTVLIGHESSELLQELPKETASLPALARVSVPSGSYMEFTTRKGPIWEVTAEAWQDIWSYFNQSEVEQRTYAGDYELYDFSKWTPDEAVVSIYIGIRG
ncbi:AraC family transcriptional regulator [Paenibacillus sambharensis]|uniref:AraC family transcriptional regulator n=1 Tax=Paenibacillus sambharensis TaxID=1803190 RepID=A0A2W1LMS2_9BACL|nr:effector binding domain-containing protein [Paenibacillus sambharensis]PZD93091.1 AraC family transcriptional regulator [Paenibacillus sambharensis]